MLGLLFLGVLGASAAALLVTQPAWHVAFSPQEYGQVDNVVLSEKTLFASLIAGVSLVGFSEQTGNQTWTRQPTSNSFSMAAAGGPYVVAVDTSSGQLLVIACYLAASPNQRWVVQYANSSASNVVVSEDGTTVAVGVNTMVGKGWASQVVLLDGATGHLKKAFACAPPANAPQGAITGLLAMDPTGTVVAYSCITVGTETATVLVRDATLANTTKPLLQSVSEAASGTGFAISRRGAYFAFGVSETVRLFISLQLS
jgi:hypothetical protein